MVACNVVCAEDDAGARRLFTSAQQSFTNIFRGRRGRLPAPVDDIEAYWTPEEKARSSGCSPAPSSVHPRPSRAGSTRSSPRPAPTS
jgi:alkanesulfonate monooxygenase SsuD/methylene tetrahydromethanopterin reductase-like flavin-dependent oxidoreductase (luciferase family)